MRTTRAVGLLALVLAMSGLVAEQASACRIVPTPMPIVRPTRPARRPLETRRHTAEIEIKGPVARVAVDAVFYNPNAYRLEGTYFFPLEANAAVDDFQMDINGKMVRGELLDADKARGIYEGIVRKMKDPGLLEFVGTKMLKCRVYPMEPNSETKVKLTYSLALKSDGGLYGFTYPLRSARPEAGTIGNVALRVKVEQADGIKTIYSPTHQVDVKRDGDHKATLGFEQANLNPERDFQLYFSVSRKDVGLSVVTHKPAGEAGYFLLTAAPKVEVTEAEVAAKSILFVIDTSGSMQGDKIRQAQGALRYCVNSLKPKDSFGIITFATEPASFRDNLLPASKDNVQAALAFIDKIEARGGTAIHDALLLALKTIKGAKGVPMVVFLTDGLPTIGETNVEAILKNVTGANDSKSRVFVFGVGHDVNTKLLDRLAEDNHGAPDYVTEKEDIEVKVSNFYQKVASPVLADVTLAFPGLKVTEMYPREVGDLFRGSQLMVLGRFDGGGHKAVKLAGTVDGKARQFVFETTFAETKDNTFLPRLWATRKVAYLLDEIRLHGKNQELVDEVVRLGKRHGIMTPYTSFLVVEDGARPQLEARLGGARMSLEGQASGRGAVERARELAEAKGGANSALPAPAKPGEPAADFYGFAEAEKKDLGRMATTRIVHIAGKTFYRKPDGVLYDSLYDEAKHKDKIIEVKALSDEYFALLKQHDGIGRFLAEGKPMVLIFDGKVYRIKI